MAIYVGDALLLVKSSYRAEWGLPGGSIRRGEEPHAAAQREMDEEIGLSPQTLRSVGCVSGVWDGRRDRVHLFELRLEQRPALRLDHREIVAARWVPLEHLGELALTGAVAAYVARDIGG